jgi:hypothetical protein
LALQLIHCQAVLGWCTVLLLICQAAFVRRHLTR